MGRRPRRERKRDDGLWRVGVRIGDRGGVLVRWLGRRVCRKRRCGVRFKLETISRVPRLCMHPGLCRRVASRPAERAMPTDEDVALRRFTAGRAPRRSTGVAWAPKAQAPPVLGTPVASPAWALGGDGRWFATHARAALEQLAPACEG